MRTGDSMSFPSMLLPHRRLRETRQESYCWLGWEGLTDFRGICSAEDGGSALSVEQLAPSHFALVHKTPDSTESTRGLCPGIEDGSKTELYYQDASKAPPLPKLLVDSSSAQQACQSWLRIRRQDKQEAEEFL